MWRPIKSYDVKAVIEEVCRELTGSAGDVQDVAVRPPYVGLLVEGPDFRCHLNGESRGSALEDVESES